MRNLTVAIALVSGLIAGSASAHEFWIEPLAYQVGAEGRLEGRLVNGQQFEPSLGKWSSRAKAIARSGVLEPPPCRLSLVSSRKWCGT